MDVSVNFVEYYRARSVVGFLGGQLLLLRYQAICSFGHYLEALSAPGSQESAGSRPNL